MRRAGRSADGNVSPAAGLLRLTRWLPANSRGSARRASIARDGRDYRVVAWFVLSGLVALAAVAAIDGYFLQKTSIDEAVQDAQNATEVIGHGVVEPLLVDGILTGDTQALANLDQVARQSLIKEPIVRIKIWTADGRIIYSDEPRLIGLTYPLGEEDIAALQGGPTAADLSDLSQPENTFERGHGQLFQVYMGLHTQGGTPVLFEEYLSAASVDSTGHRIWRSFLPAVVVGIVVLELVQLPLAWTVAHRLWRNKNDRLALLHNALESSDVERRRLAGAVHDGVVQKLTGLSYSLQAKADRLSQTESSEATEALRHAAADTRANVQELRATLVDIYPPNLGKVGLTAVISDLAAPLTAAGIDVRIEVPPNLTFTPEIEGLVFRAARETFANVMHHAGAHSVTTSVRVAGNRVVMVVQDDGRGFSGQELEARQADGHIGLRLLADMVRHAGGAFDVDSHPGSGTRVLLEVPLR